jgi:hypothetical protein
MADRNLEVVNLPPPVEPAENIAPVLCGARRSVTDRIQYPSRAFLQYVTTFFLNGRAMQDLHDVDAARASDLQEGFGFTASATPP